MSMIEFTVPVDPFGKGRPRFSANGGSVVAYTPSKTRRLENTFKFYARRAMGNRYPFERGTPLKVKLIAYFPIPKSYPQSRRDACINNVEKPTKKPDIDNIVKAVLDAMNDCVYWDDKDVVSLSVEKKYTEGDGRIDVECGVI